MQCPACRLINPDTALRCDCGHSFQNGRSDMTEDVKALREIAERKQKAEATAGIFALLLVALVVGWCVHANNAVEAEKKWCRESLAEEFVDQFETRCAQHRSDPAIKARIERIMSGKEK